MTGDGCIYCLSPDCESSMMLSVDYARRLPRLRSRLDVGQRLHSPSLEGPAIPGPSQGLESMRYSEAKK